MHILNVKLLGAEGQVSLMFKTEQAAHERASEISVNGANAEDQHRLFTYTDNYGTTLICRGRDIIFVAVVDVAQNIVTQGEMQLIQMREQAAFQKKAQALAGLTGVMPKFNN